MRGEIVRTSLDNIQGNDQGSSTFGERAVSAVGRRLDTDLKATQGMIIGSKE